MNATITAVPGLRAGHATVAGGGSGCTVLIGPFRGAVELAGMATGSRELGVLDPRHVAPAADALLLTGGSAFGLAAADGVMGWLDERGVGYDTGRARVPLVPAAVLYDLAEGVPRPDAALGRAACEAASDAPLAEGRVGAGAGATVGKLGGPGTGSPGGVGSAAGRSGAWAVGALAVVNAVGNVLDGEGRVVGGAAAPTQGAGRPPAAPPLGNTTLCVVATDAPASRAELGRIVRVAATALPRRIDPVCTPFDGDLVFALSTGIEVAELSALQSLALGMALADLLAEAITRAVTAGR